VKRPSSEKLVERVTGGLQLIDCRREPGKWQSWRRCFSASTEALLQCYGGSLHFPGGARDAFNGSRFLSFAVGWFHAQYCL
jgi:hypothetical protein